MIVPASRGSPTWVSVRATVLKLTIEFADGAEIRLEGERGQGRKARKVFDYLRDCAAAVPVVPSRRQRCDQRPTWPASSRRSLGWSRNARAVSEQEEASQWLSFTAHEDEVSTGGDDRHRRTGQLGERGGGDRTRGGGPQRSPGPSE